MPARRRAKLLELFFWLVALVPAAVDARCVDDGLRVVQLNCTAGDPNTPTARQCRGIQRILDASCSQLGSVAYLESVILDVGLMGGTETTTTLLSMYGPQNLRAVYRQDNEHGLWQDPWQLAHAFTAIGEALVDSDAQGAVSRYIEIGVYTGWTTCLVAAFVRRMTGRARHFEGYAVDVTQQHITPATRSLFAQLNVVFHTPGTIAAQLERWTAHWTSAPGVGQGGGGDTVHGITHRRPPSNLCFIDGDHSFKGVHRDYVLYAPLCRVVMLHDIIDYRVFKHHKGGVPGFWALLMQVQRANASSTCHSPGSPRAHGLLRQFTKRRGRGFYFGLGLLVPPPHAVHVVEHFIEQADHASASTSALACEDALARLDSPESLRRPASSASQLIEAMCQTHSPLMHKEERCGATSEGVFDLGSDTEV